jgi:hypothetical protein
VVRDAFQGYAHAFLMLNYKDPSRNDCPFERHHRSSVRKWNSEGIAGPIIVNSNGFATKLCRFELLLGAPFGLQQRRLEAN